MSEIKKYVRIKKSKKSSHWYANKIGQVFEIEREANLYATRRKTGRLSPIRKEDAELIVTEKRPAKVGERVLITNTEDSQAYKNGEEYEVNEVYYISVSIKDRSLLLYHDEYEVIVNNEVKNEEADKVESQLLIENAKTVFEKKGDRYFGYKSRLGDIVIGGNYSYAFVVHYAKTNEDVVIIPGDVNTVTTPVCTTEEERLWKPEKTAQERRDEIVEQAKADVSGLLKRDIGHDHEFIVNTEKRTVVVLRKLRGCTNIVRRGIAKAAPDDCFNVHIEKAIALYRALGLEVPDEYLNMPQPREVRVGDVVMSIADKSKVYVIVDDEKRLIDGEAARTSIVAKYGKIIDDSRTGAI
ncbi:hypothetical protein ACFUP3_11890 [Bacillus paralicheniformis]|uniref:hypothetical protein n=1 Tax=Bacillus paralicheniformis TaxID=1648923 RepID=UPI0036263859